MQRASRSWPDDEQLQSSSRTQMTWHSLVHAILPRSRRVQRSDMRYSLKSSSRRPDARLPGGFVLVDQLHALVAQARHHGGERDEERRHHKLEEAQLQLRFGLVSAGKHHLQNG